MRRLAAIRLPDGHITQLPTPPSPTPPVYTSGTGILDKWRYAPFYDVFVGLEDINEGHIWIYKPLGMDAAECRRETNATVSELAGPAARTTRGAVHAASALRRTSSDPDGSDRSVSSTTQTESSWARTGRRPYSVPWTPLYIWIVPDGWRSPSTTSGA